MATAIASIGLGATLAGGLLSARAEKQSGEAQQQMYNYQAQVAKINSQIDLQNRDYAIDQGQREAEIAGMKGGQQFGAIRTAQGASGFDVNTGSAARVQDSQRKVTQMDLSQIRTNAAKTAYDFTVKSTMDTNQATLDTIAGQNAKIAGDIRSTASILGTIGSVSSKWLAGNTAGLWGGKSSGSSRETMGLDGLAAIG